MSLLLSTPTVIFQIWQPWIFVPEGEKKACFEYSCMQTVRAFTTYWFSQNNGTYLIFETFPETQNPLHVEYSVISSVPLLWQNSYILNQAS